MSDFRKALLWTAVPIVVLAIVSAAIVASAPYDIGAVLIAGVAWVFAAGYWVLALIAGIYYSVRHQRQLAAGIFAGIGIGFAALGVSCFAIFAISE